MQARIDALTTELDQLRNPRVDYRERWNSDDAGPQENLDALKGGRGELDRQGQTALQAELAVEATRALIEKQAVRPLAGAWEG